MLSFFKCGKPNNATQTQEKNKLSKVLTKLDAFINAVITSNHPHIYSETSSRIFRADEASWKNPEEFLRHVNNCREWFKLYNDNSNKSFKIAFGTDLNEWREDEIDNLKIFFAAFKEFPVVFTISEQQINSLESIKFVALLNAMKESTSPIHFRIGFPYDPHCKLAFHISGENGKRIREALPNAVIEQGQYFGSSDKSELTHSLIYTEHKNTLEVRVKNRREVPDRREVPEETKSSSFLYN